MCIRAATGQRVAFQIYNLKTIALNSSKEKQGQLKKKQLLIRRRIERA
jgi:hypothetical protein